MRRVSSQSFSSVVRWFVLAVVSLLLTGTASWAQNVNAAINGVVTDPVRCSHRWTSFFGKQFCGFFTWPFCNRVVAMETC